ncbi:keratin, type I cytoskeletal 19-like [Bufo bufo]|uniref:keratin, type I cytoskeletal 19-like n=1 Tax=Bufo bufo TaxID=8384 RepID=UPI001ABE28FB|nr:keratin, type I cytoskeletal 19-like [Bufo bufo]
MTHGISHSSSKSLKGHYHTAVHCSKASSHISSLHRGERHKVHHKNSAASHHGGHRKMPIVHGGSKVSFSAHSSSGHGHGAVHCGHSYGIHHGWNNTGLLSINEKETLQHLNQRLSSYLDKVHSLEQENALLERKICEWYANNAPISLPDSSQYSGTIQEIQNMILSTTMENARLERQKDNAQQATIDLRRRYQMEVNLRHSIEFDIAEQSKALSEFNMTVQDLERQVQCLQEELFQMKNNHAGEVSFLRQQLGARVNVEMNAAPSVDLSQVLSEVRDEYENLMERNLMEVESMFQTRSAELNQEVSIGAEQLQTTSNEIIDLKRSVQALEIELQTQMSLNNALGSTLAETEATFSAQLAQLQCLIDNIEAPLAQIRSTLERQNYQYQLLMDQKNQLDMEISTYRHLLDGHNINVPTHNFFGAKHAYLNELHNALEDQENRGRRNNLRLRGIPKSVSPGDIPAAVKTLCTSLLGPDFALDIIIERAHRALRPKPKPDDPPSDVICKFLNFQVKVAVQEADRNQSDILLEGAPVSIYQDLAPSTLRKRKTLKPLTEWLRELTGQ